MGFTSMVQAQWIENPEAWLKKEYLFSPNTIKKHGIDSLCGTYYVRYGKGVFHKTGGQIFLQFDEGGRATRIQQYKPDSPWLDSLTFTYQYSPSGQLQEEKISDRYGFSQINFQYPKYNLHEESHYIGLQDGRSMLANEVEIHRLKGQNAIWEIHESYKNGNLFKKSSCFKDPVNFDSTVVQVTYPSLDTTFKTYRYQENRLIGIEVRFEQQLDEIEINYDPQGEIISIHRSSNQEKTEEIQFIYSDSRLASAVFYSLAQQRMEIVKF
ncbi:MAG: hypothetical protein ACKO5L_04100 [Bacteroidota bacterium]